MKSKNPNSAEEIKNLDSTRGYADDLRKAGASSLVIQYAKIYQTLLLRVQAGNVFKKDFKLLTKASGYIFKHFTQKSKPAEKDAG